LSPLSIHYAKRKGGGQMAVIHFQGGREQLLGQWLAAPGTRAVLLERFFGMRQAERPPAPQQGFDAFFWPVVKK
jgi:hypothetical protein